LKKYEKNIEMVDP